MELRIDFYSKKELAIRMDFAGRYPFPANETSELFLFSCYTLRQLSNLGNHPVSTLLAVLLTTFDKDTALELAEGNYKFPGPIQFGVLTGFAGVNIGVDYGVLKDQIMSELPSLVNFRGEGKKAFTVTMPPFQHYHKGFGLLGFQVNYYAFHSVIALFRFLAKRRINDNIFIDHLSQVAKYCGKAHISQRIPIGDQVTLTNAILKEIGITTQDT